MVYVISIDGKPLMPTSRHGKVRRMLKNKQAKVIAKCPFTIQLLSETGHEVQDLSLGVDTGSANLACAVTNNHNYIKYLSEVLIRNDITTKMSQRSGYRRARRNRKARYRKARFLNRKNSIKSGRFSPTMTSKINSHIREIEYVKSILPIKHLIIETGTFDMALMNHENEAFDRHWGYQKGLNYGFKNAQEAAFNRDNYTCQHCKKHVGTLNAHHIIYRSKGGADTLDNLITLCKKCHKDLHDGLLTKFEATLVGKKKGQLKHATQMNSIRVQLLNHYPEAIETFGFVTKENRQAIGLEKTHYNDAIVISLGRINKPILENIDLIVKKHVAKGSYKLANGQRSEKKLPTGKIHGFRALDKISYKGHEYFIGGRMSAGYCTLIDINGEKQVFDNPKTVKLNAIIRIQARSTAMCISQKIIQNIA